MSGASGEAVRDRKRCPDLSGRNHMSSSFGSICPEISGVRPINPVSGMICPVYWAYMFMDFGSYDQRNLVNVHTDLSNMSLNIG